MSDNVETTSSAVDTAETDTKSTTSSTSNNDTNTDTSSRLFGQFKQNGFGFHNVSTSTFGQIGSSEKNLENNSSSNYFTSTISKFSSTATGFGSSSTPLAASLASLGVNKPLFGGSSTTAPSSFTDLKATSNGLLRNKTDDDDKPKEEKDDNNDHENDNADNSSSNNKISLLETAAEYEAKRASTHPVATIQGDTSTGEENEITKFQMVGKLFMYSSEQQQFIERGYGILKINEKYDPCDYDRLQARLIMRLDKSFRVILNSPILPKMTVERATERSVRFGAQDESHLRVFIIKASSSDCSNFFKELQLRIKVIERQHMLLSQTNTPAKNSDTSTSSDSSFLDDTSPKQISSHGTRKRSHSKSDSDTPENTNDLSKKSKLIEGNSQINKDDNQKVHENVLIGESQINEQQTFND